MAVFLLQGVEGMDGGKKTALPVEDAPSRQNRAVFGGHFGFGRFSDQRAAGYPLNRRAKLRHCRIMRCMYTIAETPLFESLVNDYWTTDEHVQFCAWLANNPECGM